MRILATRTSIFPTLLYELQGKKGFPDISHSLETRFAQSVSMCKENKVRSKAVVPNMWFLNNIAYLLGTCKKCIFSVPTPDLWIFIFGIGAQESSFTYTLQRILRPLKFGNHYSKKGGGSEVHCLMSLLASQWATGREQGREAADTRAVGSKMHSLSRAGCSGEPDLQGKLHIESSMFTENPL